MTLFGDVGAMAVRALLRSWRVEHDQPSLNFLPSFVASSAWNILVCATEFESGFVVIEAGRTPEASLMAGGAILRLAREGAKLTEVNVFVTL